MIASDVTFSQQGGNTLSRRHLVTSVTTLLLVFVVDVYLPVGAGGAIPHVGAVLISLWLSTRATLLITFAASVLTALGAMIGEESSTWSIVVSRSLTLYGVWVAAVLGLCLKEAERRRRQSETELQTVIDTGREAVIVFDEAGSVKSVSRSFERMFGRDSTACLDADVQSFFPEMDATRREQIAGEIERRDSPFVLEITGRNVRGDAFPADVALSRVNLPDRNYFVGCVTDLSEKRELLRSAAYLAAIVNSSDDAILGIDPDGTIASWNHGAEAILGHTAEEVIGEPAENLVIPGDSNRIGELLLQAFKGHGTQGQLCRWRRKDARVVSTSLTLSPIHDQESRIIGVSVTARDIGERIAERLRLEAAYSDLEERIRERTSTLAQTNDQLQAKNEELEQFVYAASHDLKSPIVTCKGFVGLLREDFAAGRSDAVLDSVARIERATQHMSMLIDDLLQFSRVGRLPGEPELLDVNAVVEEILARLAQPIEEAGASVTLQEDIPPVRAKRASFVRVVENLLNNALKYGCRESDSIITIGGERVHAMNDAAAEVRIFVRDNGPGIDPLYHQRVFKLFHRLQREKEGSGIGLAVVAKVMHLHGGRVWVDSKPGDGATFLLAFPEDESGEVPPLAINAIAEAAVPPH